MEVTQLSSTHQVTIPAKIIAERELAVGTDFAVTAGADGTIVLHPVDGVAARRLKAIDELAGSMKGVWEPGDVDRLREDWRR